MACRKASHVEFIYQADKPRLKPMPLKKSLNDFTKSKVICRFSSLGLVKSTTKTLDQS